MSEKWLLLANKTPQILTELSLSCFQTFSFLFVNQTMAFLVSEEEKRKKASVTRVVNPEIFLLFYLLRPDSPVVKY